MKIKIASGHFWLDFDNGYTLSAFNGYGSFTENRYVTFNDILNKKSWESRTVEIGIFKDNKLITNEILNCDDIVKTVKLEELIAIINFLLNYKGGNDDIRYYKSLYNI